MWLGQCTTGSPASISICLMSFTLRWCWRLKTWPSALFRVRTDSRAPARSMGGRDVVKIKPAAYERTVSIRALVLEMYPPTQPKALPKKKTNSEIKSVSNPSFFLPPIRMVACHALPTISAPPLSSCLYSAHVAALFLNQSYSSYTARTVPDHIKHSASDLGKDLRSTVKHSLW